MLRRPGLPLLPQQQNCRGLPYLSPWGRQPIAGKDVSTYGEQSEPGDEMKRVMAGVLVAIGALAFEASASPIPVPPELWVMKNDGTDQRALTDPDDGFGYATDVSWSPDSTRLVTTGIVVLDVASGESVRLAEGRNPDWSPTSNDIAFAQITSTETAYDERLYIMDADGGEPRLLVDTAELDTHPAWSPDGSQVAFVSGPASGAPGRVYTVNADGTGLRPLSEQRALYVAPEWSPDGKRLAYETFASRLRIIDIASGTEEDLLGFDYSSQPSWCSDQTLYFVGDPVGEAGPGIYSLPVGGNPTFVTEGADPDCSSAGTLAFTRQGDIHLLEPGTAGVPNLTATADRSDISPRWSPDGARIAFESQENWPPATPVERDLTLSLRRHLIARGRVTASPEGVCRSRVLLQKLTNDGWRTVRRISAGYEGRFRVTVPDRPGFYRAVVRHNYSIYGEWECLRTVSPIVRHRH